jgi:hypothetical protein
MKGADDAGKFECYRPGLARMDRLDPPIERLVIHGPAHS